MHLYIGFYATNVLFFNYEYSNIKIVTLNHKNNVYKEIL